MPASNPIIDETRRDVGPPELESTDPTRVLIVDDNHAIHDDIRKVFAADPHAAELDKMEMALFGRESSPKTTDVFRFDSAYQGQQGLQLVEAAARQNDPFAVAIIDMRMPPGWNGIETIERVWRVDPRMQIIVCTAYTDYSWEQMVQRLGTTDRMLILKKPFDNLALRQMVHAVSRKWILARLVDSQLRYMDALVAKRTAALSDENKTLAYQANHDGLTKLVNRREFERRLDFSISTAAPGETTHSLCYLDLDRFKLVNDSAGHAAGDQLLIEVASLLRSIVRKRDTVARLGGDEFALLLDGCPINHAEKIAAEALRAIDELVFEWEGTAYSIGVSVGVVGFPGDQDDVASVMQLADSACYIAKNNGRNCVHVARTQDLLCSKRGLEISQYAKIQEALEQDRFVLEFQAVLPLRRTANRRRQFEVLLRLQGADGRLELPGDFLPAAERYGITAEIDRWVIRMLLEELTRIDSRVPGEAMFSVNLSAQSVLEGGFVDDVLALLRETQVAPERVCFEIAEKLAMANLSRTAEFISELRDCGCHIALDDFGRGMSSYAYLKDLPVDFLKIDRDLVSRVTTEPFACAMVKSISEIARVLGKKTIGKYVESEAVLDRLRDLHVDFAQGFLIARPNPSIASGHEMLDVQSGSHLSVVEGVRTQ